MECSEDIRILLAGYVDDQLSSVERLSVEEHLRTCDACRGFLQEQQGAVAVYAQYPVHQAAPAQFDAMWTRLESRLPQPAKRVSLDRLTEIGAGHDLADAEEEAAVQAPKAPPVQAPARQRPAAPQPAQPQQPSDARRRGDTRAQRPPIFKPLRFPRLKHTFWAHAAGIAASILIPLMVFLSIKPVIRVKHFARSDQVQISFPGDDPSGIPMVMSLPTNGDGGIPLVWIADVPDDDTEPEKGIIQ